MRRIKNDPKSLETFPTGRWGLCSVPLKPGGLRDCLTHRICWKWSSILHLFLYLDLKRLVDSSLLNTCSGESQPRCKSFILCPPCWGGHTGTPADSPGCALPLASFPSLQIRGHSSPSTSWIPWREVCWHQAQQTIARLRLTWFPTNKIGSCKKMVCFKPPYFGEFRYVAMKNHNTFLLGSEIFNVRNSVILSLYLYNHHLAHALVRGGILCQKHPQILKCVFLSQGFSTLPAH